MPALTLYDKLWNNHIVQTNSDGMSLIYIDRHLIHEVTSPQAFEGLRIANRNLWRVDANFAVPDHNIPTDNRKNGISNAESKLQIETLDSNCSEFKILEFGMNHPYQGIVHVIGPEQGITLPGMTIVCGDSHTSTHGALGALAFGIGTSEVEHVLATQCLIQKKSKNMLIKINGHLQDGITSKDLILFIIGKIGTAGGTGFTIEFAGSAIEQLSIESRMTICNMAIEAGARAGLIAVDEKTIEFVKNKPFAPKNKNWNLAENFWRTLKSDSDAFFDKIIEFDANEIKPMVTWGTSPEMVTDIENIIPFSSNENYDSALNYMDLKSGTPIKDIYLDKIFIGSCTNSRIEDLRIVAKIVNGKKIAKNIKLAMIVPGSGVVKLQAEKEGLDKIFIASGFQWRESGCSMCLGMNPDKLSSGERCASTSNRNFEGRQGPGGRTHLVSPAMAAAAAIEGHFVNILNYQKN